MKNYKFAQRHIAALLSRGVEITGLSIEDVDILREYYCCPYRADAEGDIEIKSMLVDGANGTALRVVSVDRYHAALEQRKRARK